MLIWRKIQTMFLLALLAPIAGAAEDKVFPEGFWRRAGLGQNYCNQVGSQFNVNIKVKEHFAAEEAIKKFLKKHKALVHPINCTNDSSGSYSGSSRQPIDVWLSEKDILALQKLVLKLGQLRSWQKLNIYQPDKGSNVVKKWDILTEELENKKIFRKVPHIQALVESELSRLKPYVDFLKKVHGKIRLKIKVVE